MFNFKARLVFQVLLLMACRAAAAEPALETSMLDVLPKDLNLVFCTRLPYDDGHWYANIGYYSTNENAKAYCGNGKPDKSVLYRYQVASKEKRVIFDAQGGGIRDPAVHYDGKTILFSYRPDGTDYYNLYTIQSDGSNLRQITSGPWDDYEACWLPDGGIVFVSTRCKRWVGCWFTQVGILHRCNADGSGIKQLSANIEHDNTPCVLPDGRILFMRWEYVDRSQVEYHALWTMNPDGTAVNVYYGNMHSWIAMLDPQAIPDTQEVIASFSPGHGANEHRGPPTIVSPLRGPDCKEAAVRIGTRNDIHDPYPLSKDLFLMACGKSILMMDRNGKEIALYTDPDLNVHEPRPLLPRPREKHIPSRFLNPSSTDGQFILQNVYVGRNMKEVHPGDIKKLLVLEVLPKPANFSGGMDQTSNLGTFNLERVLGTVPVEADGSASFIAPAGRPLFFVALDKDDLSVKRMQSFCNLMPGETYTCVGCHEERNSAADAKPAPPTLLALKRQPSRIQRFEAFPDVFDYQRDIQPVLDRNCVACHNAEKRAGRMDLSAGLSVRFSKSYMALFLRRLVVDGANGLGNRPPRSVGSSASPLLTYMRNGHKDTKVSQKDWWTVWLWIESGALYAGSCAGIRNVEEQNYYGAAWGHAAHGVHTVANKRCASCHKNEKERNVSGIPFNEEIRREKESKKWGRPMAAYERLTTTNDPASFFDMSQLVDLTHPERSAFLRVPLAKAAGGLEHHGHVIFKDTNDPDYQFALACIQRAQKVYADRPAWGMQGWRPNKDYIREMKRFGILPGAFDGAKDTFDPFKTDQNYWRSLWPSLEPGFGSTETQAEYVELKRVMAESKAWNVMRLQKESMTPEVMLPATEKHPALVALKQALALAKDLAGAGVDVSKEKAALEALQAPCATGQTDEASFNSVVAIRRTLAFKNPLLNFKGILFQKHNKPFDKMSLNGKTVSRGENHMIDQYLGFNQIKGGGVFVLENAFSDKPTARNVLSQPVQSGRLKGKTLGDEGSFVGLDLDYDASRIVFAYTEAEWGGDNKEPNIPDDWDWADQPAGPRKSGGQPAHAKHYYWKKESAFHIFSANADGSDLKQLTDSMWNDTHPAWLPNGRIVFVSERDAGQTRCSGRAVPCTTLYGMMGDGSDIVRFSYHETTEWQPSVDNSGMIVYTRWDYVDRDSDVAHHPWLCFPDGRNPRAFHGNYPRKREMRPWMEMNIRAIPNSPLYMATAAAHHGQAYGSMILVDPRESDDNEMSQVKRVTPEYFFPESEDLPGKPMSIGKVTRNKSRTSYIEPLGTPWPLSEKYYLAVYARSGEESYGIYLCDMWGNKELLYREEGMSALQPIPFVPRKRPPIVQNASKLAKADRPANKPMPTTGEVAINDVYQSILPWPTGRKLKEIRVVVVFPKDTYELSDPKVGVAEQSLARGSLGTVPIEEDGSVYFTMPAGCEFYMQVLDEKGMAVQSMRSGTYVHPGEKMSCVGCHEPKHTGSLREGKMPKAFMRPPSTLKSEGAGTFPITFPRLVQPVLDKHCVTCHDENRAKGKKQVPSLATASDKCGWSESYSTLTKNHAKTNSIAWSMCGGNGIMEQHKELQYSIPGEIGAFKSNLYKMLSSGHKGVKLSPEEMRRITCWLDCNSVFYGAYQEAPAQAKGSLVWPKLGLPIGFTKDEVKVRNFTVNPSTGPLGAVDVYGDWKGSVMLTPPEGWMIDPQTVKVEGANAPFRVVKAAENKANQYAFGVTIDGKVQQQTVCVASAPYGKLAIDAKPDKLWQDGIPLDWETDGKNTVLRMFWNEEKLYLAVELEGGLKSLQYGFGFIKKNGTKVYHEFETDAQSKTSELTIEDGKLIRKAVTAKSLSASDKGITICEIELPVEAVEGIRFDAGREFYFSLIVQDSEGKIRDLGERMNRPASTKRKGAWMGLTAELYDAWSIFGCCSSIH